MVDAVEGKLGHENVVAVARDTFDMRSPLISSDVISIESIC